MDEVKRLSERGKAALERVRELVKSKHMELDQALAHAFIAGTEHMAKMRNIEERENPPLTDCEAFERMLARACVRYQRAYGTNGSGSLVLSACQGPARGTAILTFDDGSGRLVGVEGSDQ